MDYCIFLFSHGLTLQSHRGRGCGLVDRAADSGPCDPSSIPLGEKKENKRKEAGVGPFKKKNKFLSALISDII